MAPGPPAGRPWALGVRTPTAPGRDGGLTPAAVLGASAGWTLASVLCTAARSGRHLPEQLQEGSDPILREEGTACRARWGRRPSPAPPRPRAVPTGSLSRGTALARPVRQSLRGSWHPSSHPPSQIPCSPPPHNVQGGHSEHSDVRGTARPVPRGLRCRAGLSAPCSGGRPLSPCRPASWRRKGAPRSRCWWRCPRRSPGQGEATAPSLADGPATPWGPQAPRAGKGGWRGGGLTVVLDLPAFLPGLSSSGRVTFFWATTWRLEGQGGSAPVPWAPDPACPPASSPGPGASPWGHPTPLQGCLSRCHLMAPRGPSRHLHVRGGTRGSEAPRPPRSHGATR